MCYVYNLNTNLWETPHIIGKLPEQRYAHTCTIFKDKIYIYGGVLENSTVTNEIWAFDILSKTWENVSVNENCTNKTMCGPLKVFITLVPRSIVLKKLSNLYNFRLLGMHQSFFKTIMKRKKW